MKTPINEYSSTVINTQGKAYTEIGAGLNYQKDDGSWDVASAQIVSATRPGIDYECYTTYNRVGFKSNINNGAYSVFSQIGNTGQILKSKPVALAYLNIETKEWQIIANLQNSIAQVAGNKIRYNDAFLNCDIEYVIQKDRLKQNLYIKSKVGFPVSPYPSDKTYVVIVTKFDLANYELPVLEDATARTEFNNIGGEGESICFSRQFFMPSSATDNVGDTQKIKKRLVKKAGEYYLLEGLPYSWLASANYPVLLDYTTVSGAIAANTTWNAGTYYVSDDITVNSYVTLTLAAGCIVKIAPGKSINGAGGDGSSPKWDLNGTSANPVYVTSKNDNTIGDTIDGSSGTPAIGDWTNFINSGNYGHGWATIDFAVIRYGTNLGSIWSYEFTNSYFYDSVVSYVTNYDHITYGNGYSLDKRCEFHHITYYTNGGGGTGYFKNRYDCYIHDISNFIGGWSDRIAFYNCLFKNIYQIRCADSSACITLKNCTIDGSTYGVYPQKHWTEGAQHYCTIDIKNCIFMNISNTAIKLTVYDVSDSAHDYNLFYNCTNNFDGTYATQQAHEIINTDPVLAGGTLSKSGIFTWDDDHFLNQSTSPCINAGSDTAANLGMDTYTTSPSASTDGGTVDIGYHYIPADVATATNETVTPSALTLTLTSPAPVITAIQNATITPSALNLNLTLSEVVVSAVTNITILPSVLELGLSLEAPVISAIQNVTISSSVIELALSLEVPQVNYDFIVSASALELVLAQPEVVITAIQNITVGPSALELTFALRGVTVIEGGNVTLVPPALTLSLSLGSPQVNFDYVLGVSAIELTFTQQAPVISLSIITLPSALGLATFLSDVIVVAQQNVTLTPSVIELVLSLPAHTVNIRKDILLTPSTLELLLSLQDPAITGGTLISPSVLQLALALKDPALQYPGIVTVSALNLILGANAPRIRVLRKVSVTVSKKEKSLSLSKRIGGVGIDQI